MPQSEIGVIYSFIILYVTKYRFNFHKPSPLFLAFAQGDDGGDARGPGGQIFDERHEFHQKCWQQQNVKAKNPHRQQHRHGVYGLIRAEPAGGIEQELQAVGANRHGERQQHPLARQLRDAEAGTQFFRQIHFQD